MNNHIIFDIAQKSYNWYPLIIGLIIILIGILRFKSVHDEPEDQWLTGLTIIGGFLVGLIGFGIVLFQIYNWQSYEKILSTGQAYIVEGKIENFHPMPKGGHDSENFTVNGVPFAYSDFTVTPAFNNTSSRGGPLSDGMFVKIYYTESREFGGTYAILRIEQIDQ